MRKWYSLIDKVYAMDNLRLAFKHVKSNNGAGDRWADREGLSDAS